MLNETLIFEDSHAVCGQNGGGLAEIPDRSVEDLVIKKFRESWRRIGVYRTKNNNTLINMLNRTQVYTHWEVGQPSTYVYEDSVVLTKQGWRLIPKNFVAKAVCSKKVCTCPCKRTRDQVVVNNSVLQAKIKAMKQDLSVKTRKLSRTLRKKTSATDARISSVLIGSSSGLILFTAILSLAILFDMCQKNWRCVNCALH